jgi:hypothetical protein
MIGQLWAETQMIHAEIAATQRRLSLTPSGSQGGGSAISAAARLGNSATTAMQQRRDSGLSQQSQQSAASHSVGSGSVITLSPRDDANNAETPIGSSIGSLDPSAAVDPSASAAVSLNVWRAPLDDAADAALGAGGLSGGSLHPQEGEAGDWYARRW